MGKCNTKNTSSQLPVPANPPKTNTRIYCQIARVCYVIKRTDYKNNVSDTSEDKIMPLVLDTGFASEKGKRPVNTDAGLINVPDIRSASSHSALFAIADGLEGKASDDEAAKAAVTSLRDAYYTTPRQWKIEKAIRESFSVANNTVINEGEKNRATTLSALVLRGTTWAVGHTGNTRVYLFRDQRLKQLTNDHTEPSVSQGTIVIQACGLDATLEIEVSQGNLEEDDIFLLTTNGVHDVVSGIQVMGCLLKDDSAEHIAENLVKLALEGGSSDNVSACLVSVEKLPDKKSGASVATTVSALPIGPLPEEGSIVDNFEIIKSIHKSDTAVVYKAVDGRNGETVSLRFPNPEYANDHEFVDAFLREEWIGQRHNNIHLIRTLEIEHKRRNVLYSVLEYREGEILSRRIRRKEKLSVKETLFLAKQILNCLSYLHKQGITHRDINPGNIIVDKKQKKLLLVGFGLSSIDEIKDSGPDVRSYHGTKSFQAPELLQGHESDKKSDIFSVGVTLYKMLTGRYPYGRVTSINNDTFKNYTTPRKYNSDIPKWLSRFIKKACDPNPAARFQSVNDMIEVINQPPEENLAISLVRRTHIKKPSHAWQWLVIILFTGLLAGLLYFYL